MFQFEGAWSLFGGLSPPKFPRGAGLGLGLGQVLSNFLWPCSPWHFHRWAHTPKISYDKKAVENNKNLFTIEHIMILKIIFTDVSSALNFQKCSGGLIAIKTT